MCYAGRLEVAQEDMEAALAGFSPASSWGVGRASAGDGPGPRGWQDVGGLEDVREALQETLELPTRYAKLIAKCAPLLVLTNWKLGFSCRTTAGVQCAEIGWLRILWSNILYDPSSCPPAMPSSLTGAPLFCSSQRAEIG